MAVARLTSSSVAPADESRVKRVAPVQAAPGSAHVPNASTPLGCTDKLPHVAPERLVGEPAYGGHTPIVGSGLFTAPANTGVVATLKPASGSAKS